MSQNKKIVVRKILSKALNEKKVPSVTSLCKKIGQEFKISKIHGRQINIFNKEKKSNLVITVQDTTSKTSYKVYLPQRYMDIIEEIKENVFIEHDYKMTEKDFIEMYFHVTGFNTSLAKAFPILEFSYEKINKIQKTKLIKKSNISTDGEESENDQISENENDLGKLFL